ncbi:acetyl-CoA synthetase-like protein [Aspergillus pseudodeflectus]|uniref:Acetyl-CoA synthetase-like protein n=1 Tax=Aspergillus pseudodeflectus TaxID=176178 RepID=A0ABR4JKD0_9EURO
MPPGPSIVRGPLTPPPLERTISDLLNERCTVQPHTLAIAALQQNQQLLWSDLRHRVDRLVSGLAALGLSKGHRLGVMLGNRLEYMEIFLAGAELGAYVTLLNYGYTAQELVAALKVSQCSILITTLKTSRYNYQAALECLKRKVSSLEHIIILPDIDQRNVQLPSGSEFWPYMEVVAGAPLGNPSATPAGSHRDILNLQFTSGSTGLPKAAALTQYGITNSARYLALRMEVTPQDRLLVPVPLFHAFGLIMGLCVSIASGAAAILPSEYYDPVAALRAVERYRCTGIYGVPTMMVDMLSHPDLAKTSRSSLRFGLMAGAPMPDGLLNRAIATFPLQTVFASWGMTELSSVATMTKTGDPACKYQTAGQLLPNMAAKIVEPGTGRPVPWGERGEIVVSGFGVMHSYYNDPTRTAETLRVHREDLETGGAGRDPSGALYRWLHTGDEAYVDEDGYFIITGRIKDLIIRGGENISPLEIEARLFEHPQINQASVFAIPSARYGEEVAAILELREENGKIRPSDAQIRGWVQQTLARYKAPAYIWWLGDAEQGVPATWPTTANGKIRKVKLRELGKRLVAASRRSAL